MAEPSTPRSSSARTGALIFTALSVVLAATGGWLLWHLLSVGGYDREPLRRVVVATHTIGAGRPLRAEDLQVKAWPASSVPAGSYSDPVALVEPKAAVPTAGFVEGEPILKERLASPEAGPGLSAILSNNARAVTVQVDRAMAAARLLYPGAHVDVLVTLEDKLHGAIVTRTVLEDVRVLAIGTYADIDAARRGADPAKPTNDAEAVVTLEVSPIDAERLALSARQGKLDLTLRNATDRSRSATPGVAVSELVQNGRAAPVVEPPHVAEVAAPSSGRRRNGPPPTGNNPSTPPTVRSFPRPAGGDQKPASSTIEVYSVPTQTR